MFVYVIGAGPHRHKIGKARDPEERRRMLQTGSPEPLSIVYQQRVTNPLGVEAMAHRLLADYRLGGEWFSSNQDDAVRAVGRAVEALNAADHTAPIEKVASRLQSGVGLEARRKAVRTYHAKREAAGLKKVTLWLSPEARDALDALKGVHGSKDAAAEAAILKLRG